MSGQQVQRADGQVNQFATSADADREAARVECALSALTSSYAESAKRRKRACDDECAELTADLARLRAAADALRSRERELREKKLVDANAESAVLRRVRAKVDGLRAEFEAAKTDRGHAMRQVFVEEDVRLWLGLNPFRRAAALDAEAREIAEEVMARPYIVSCDGTHQRTMRVEWPKLARDAAELVRDMAQFV